MSEGESVRRKRREGRRGRIPDLTVRFYGHVKTGGEKT